MSTQLNLTKFRTKSIICPNLDVGCPQLDLSPSKFFTLYLLQSYNSTMSADARVQPQVGSSASTQTLLFVILNC